MLEVATQAKQFSEFGASDLDRPTTKTLRDVGQIQSRSAVSGNRFNGFFKRRPAQKQ